MMASPMSYSPSIEDYVKTVYKLGESGGPAVTTTALAGQLAVTPSSASGMVRKLGELGLVVHARYREVTLTAVGERVALDVVRRHRLIERYLVDALGYSWDEVHEEAEQLEHVVSAKLVERMAQQLGHPAYDPHGDPIPDRDGKLPHVATVALSALTPGRTGHIARVRDADPGLLRHLTLWGVALGDRVEVLERQPFGGPLLVRIGTPPRDTVRTMGPGLTDAISVVLNP